ncbi:MAG: hypothetical protein NC236_00060 [Mycoplasma sp.]|nr:hypothetical protein [Mycoplasma sp.]
MTMMMKDADASPTLWDKVHSGLITVEQQMAKIYQENGISMTEEQIWSALGFTFNMSSDTWPHEIMNQADLDSMKAFAREKKLAFVGYWSIGDDNTDGVAGHGAPEGANKFYGTGAVQATLGDTFNGMQDELVQEIQISNPTDVVIKT